MPVKKETSTRKYSTRIGDFKVNGGVLEQYIGNGGEVIIPESITEIGPFAFFHCSQLTSIEIPKSVTSIGACAFDSCYRLSKIIIPGSVKVIGDSAFRDCHRLESVTLSKGINIINAAVFYNCYKLGKISIPETVIEIGMYAFDKCSSLTSILIPEGVKVIGDFAFRFCTKLTEAVIPHGVNSVGEGVFLGCSALTSVTLPFVGSSANPTSSNEETLFGYVFGTHHGNDINGTVVTKQYYSENCYRNFVLPLTLTNVTIRGGKILYGAFDGCATIKSVIIPKTAKSIGDNAFRGCTALEGVYYEGKPHEWQKVVKGEGNEPLKQAHKYYYSEVEPPDDGYDYWQYQED